MNNEKCRMRIAMEVPKRIMLSCNDIAASCFSLFIFHCSFFIAYFCVVGQLTT